MARPGALPRPAGQLPAGAEASTAAPTAPTAPAPLPVGADGRVAGVVFARGEDGDARGYAMTPTELAPALAAASASGPTVSSGACLR